MTNFQFEHTSRSETGLVRKANEDYCGDAMTALGHVFVVCDGMGGHVGGAVASKMAVECILEYMTTHGHESPVQALQQAIMFANTQIFARSHHDPSLSGMGTTCTVALFSPDAKIYYAHVGDSRIYLFSQGTLHQITRDHSYVQMLVDSGQISAAEAETHPNRNQILRALGIDEHVKPDVAPEPLLPAAGDVLLLCSDGLSGMTTDQAMAGVLGSVKGAAAAEQLIQLALNGGGKDNVTATLIEITASIHARTGFQLPAAPVRKVEEPVVTTEPTREIPSVQLPQPAGRKLPVVAMAITGIIALAAVWLLWPAKKPAAPVKGTSTGQEQPGTAPARGKDGREDTAGAFKKKPSGSKPARTPDKSGSGKDAKPSAPAPSAPAPKNEPDTVKR